MKNNKMGLKLIASYLLVISMVVATCIFLLSELSTINKSVNKSTEELYGNAVLPIINLLDTERMEQQLLIEARNILQADSKYAFNKVVSTKDSLVKVMHAVYDVEEKRTMSDEAKIIVSNFRSALNDFSIMFNEYAKNMVAIKEEERKIPVALLAKREEVSMYDADYTKHIESKARDIAEKNYATATATVTICTVVLVIMVVVSIIIGVYMTFSASILDKKIAPKLITSYLLIIIMAVAPCIFLLAKQSKVNDGLTQLYENAVLPIINLLNTERMEQQLLIEARNIQADSKAAFNKVVSTKDSLIMAMHAVYDEEEKRTMSDEAKIIVSNFRSALNDFSIMFNEYAKNMVAIKEEERKIPKKLLVKLGEVSEYNGGYIRYIERNAKAIDDYNYFYIRYIERNAFSSNQSVTVPIILVIMVVVSISIGIYMTFLISKLEKKSEIPIKK